MLSCRRREQPRVSPPSSAVYSPCCNESSVWEVHAAQTVGHGGKGHWRPKLQGPDPQEPVEKGRGHDAVPAAKMKPLGSPEDTQTGGGFASHGSAPGRTVPCRASDIAEGGTAPRRTRTSAQGDRALTLLPVVTAKPWCPRGPDLSTYSRNCWGPGAFIPHFLSSWFVLVSC